MTAITHWLKMLGVQIQSQNGSRADSPTKGTAAVTTAKASRRMKIIKCCGAIKCQDLFTKKSKKYRYLFCMFTVNNSLCSISDVTMKGSLFKGDLIFPTAAGQFSDKIYCKRFRHFYIQFISLMYSWLTVPQGFFLFH